MFVYQYFVNLWHYHSLRRFINFWRFLGYVLCGWRPRISQSWGNEAAFFIASKGDRVLKIYKCSNHDSVHMQHEAAFHHPEYRYNLYHFQYYHQLLQNLPQTRGIFPDGSYLSTLVPGYNLMTLALHLEQGKALPASVDPHRLNQALDDINANLDAVKDNVFWGLWRFEDLVYNPTENTIFYVAVHTLSLFEGDFSYITLCHLQERLQQFKQALAKAPTSVSARYEDELISQ